MEFESWRITNPVLGLGVGAARMGEKKATKARKRKVVDTPGAMIY